MTSVRLSELSSPHLASNLLHWERRYPHIAERLRSLVRADEVTVETISTGGHVVTCPDPTCEHASLSAHVTPENIAKFLDQAAGTLQRGCNFFVLVGSLAGGAAVALVRQLQQYPQCGVLLVEPTLSMLYAATFFHDLSSVISSRQVFCETGPDVLQDTVKTINEQRLFGFSNCVYLIPPGEASTRSPAHTELVPLIRIEQTASAGRWFQACKDYGARRITSANTFRRGVAYVTRTKETWLFRVTLEALVRGMREYSLDITTISLDADGYQPPLMPCVDLLDAAPDFLVSVNVPVRFFLPPAALDALHIPQVVWYVDNPIFWHRVGSQWSLGTPRPSDILMCYDRGDVATVRSWGARHVLYLPSAADFVERAPPREDLACEVSFIGSVFDQRDVYARWSPALQEFADRLIGQVYSSYPETPLRPPDFGGLLADDAFPAGATVDRRALVRYVYLEVNNRLRLDAVRRLLRFDLHVYGQPYWQVLLGEKDARRCYRGMIDYHVGPQAMVSSRVNLNVTSIQAHCALGTRCFNIIAQRGCLLTGWVDGIDHLFEPGEGVLYYRRFEELPELVERCLADPAERAKIVERGRARVLREHTFKHRAGQILSYLLANRSSFLDEGFL